MTSIREFIRRRFTPAEPISPGIYHYQAPPHAEFPYRLHLRVEGNGEGILILDAATVLHLNQTATEYAYHIVTETGADRAVQQMAQRYDISKERIKQDYQDFKDRLFTLIDLPDLDPVSFLELERDTPYSGDISAPYRLDCALTYRLPEGVDPDYAPTKRVDRELSTDEWKTILNKAWRVGIPHVVFTGGEPTLRADLAELIEHAETNGQVTGLLTDGVRLGDANYFNGLLQTGLDHLMISLHPEDERVWAALEIILPDDLFTTVHLTVTPEGSDQVPELIQKLADLGVNAISLSDVGPELDEAMSAARDLVAELDIPLVWDLPVPYSPRNPVALETDEEEYPDGAGRAWLYVEPDGDVLPTQGINEILGNFIRDDWEAIWK
jgi:organic radical activating enzyme